jgi:hypothetical protein
MAHGLDEDEDHPDLQQCIERDFDLVYSRDIRPDYASYVPLHFASPDPPVPIVRLYVNVYLPRSPRRWAGASSRTPIRIRTAS